MTPPAQRLDPRKVIWNIVAALEREMEIPCDCEGYPSYCRTCEIKDGTIDDAYKFLALKKNTNERKFQVELAYRWFAKEKAFPLLNEPTPEIPSEILETVRKEIERTQ